jgi:hypothetical protein
MRLLERNIASQLSLTKIFVGDDIPKYAILSHTWGAGTEEVPYGDVIDGTGKSKPATTRSGSVRSRLLTMACNTSGWTPAVSISQAALSFRRLLTQCFAGTRMRPLSRGLKPRLISFN